MLTLLLFLLLLACPAPVPDEDTIPPEDCGNGFDDDDDGLVDCTDPDCMPCPEVCGDGVDNDGDGLVDCEDPDCDGACPEVCDDGRDNDGDGLVDCEDPDCDGSCLERCSDGRDNDGDGLTDCEDPDCDAPGSGCREVCDDGRDNDGDGLVDCQDPDCDMWWEECPEVCDDGRDNDGDGRVDCDDPECDGVCPEVCDDGRDNDGDGLIDCQDPDCLSECPEDCENGVDDDGDLRVDCDDDDCFTTPPCTTEICDDGLDNDRDQAPDCWDEDCEGRCPELCGSWGSDFDGDGVSAQLDPDCAYYYLEHCENGRRFFWDSPRIDCDDPLCANYAECGEDCENGKDDDDDGLVDCEDADCATHPSCVEDCDDHVDNDGDGLVDCSDDDCWGPDCIESTVAFVLAGEMSGRDVVWVGDRYQSFGFNRRTRHLTRREVRDVVGEVRVLDGYGGTLATCSWWADEVSATHLHEIISASNKFSSGGNSEAEGLTRPSRMEFGVGPGCPVTSSGFLPALLVPNGSGVAVPDLEVRRVGHFWSHAYSTQQWGGVHVPGAPWYIGSEPTQIGWKDTWRPTSESDWGYVYTLGRVTTEVTLTSWPALTPTPVGFYSR